MGVGDYYDRNSLYDPYWIQNEIEKIQSKWVLFQVISNLNERQTWAGGGWNFDWWFLDFPGPWLGVAEKEVACLLMQPR
jgi:hypothetical protein